MELIRSFRAALSRLDPRGRVLATDIHELAPALYEADAHYLLPHSSTDGFPGALFDLCRREAVDLVIPLIDPDLPVLAMHRETLQAQGTRVLVSQADAIGVCQDKQATAKFLQAQSFPCPCILDPARLSDADFPLIVKPRDGSASLNVFKVRDAAQLEVFLRYVPNALVQEFVEGPEVTVDVFSNWAAETLLAAPRERLKVRGGEVATARLRRDRELERLAKGVAAALGTLGPINVQMILGPDGPRIIEINPRFGGGCQLSITAGAPFVDWALAMARGEIPAPAAPPVLRDGLVMMRYDQAIYLEPDAAVT